MLVEKCDKCSKNLFDGNLIYICKCCRGCYCNSCGEQVHNGNNTIPIVCTHLLKNCFTCIEDSDMDVPDEYEFYDDDTSSDYEFIDDDGVTINKIRSNNPIPQYNVSHILPETLLLANDIQRTYES